MSTKGELLDPQENDSQTQDNSAWHHVQTAAPWSYHRTDDGDTLYITDTHSGRLRKRGERFHAIYKKAESPYFETVDKANYADQLNLENVEGLSIQEVISDKLGS